MASPSSLSGRYCRYYNIGRYCRYYNIGRPAGHPERPESGDRTNKSKANVADPDTAGPPACLTGNGGRAAAPSAVMIRFGSSTKGERGRGRDCCAFWRAGPGCDRLARGALPVHHPHGPAADVAFSIIVGAGFAGGALPLVASHNQGTTGWPRIWDHLPGPRNDPWQ